MTKLSTVESDLADRLKRLNEIGVALSSERDLTVLLERILYEARRFTNADAGTLFLVEGDHLNFEIAQNDTLHSFMVGRAVGSNVPPVPVNKESVSGYAAVTGEILNIEDVYTDTEYSFEGPKQYDRLSGYHTKSMLGVPMKDREAEIIGVLQLINATNPVTNEVTAFNSDDEDLIQSLASQAAVAIKNVYLIGEMEKLFESFVQVMATAIDERSPYTGGHIKRVAEMTMVVARAVNRCKEGKLAAVSFNEDEMNELRIAAWMHDIGKITTPEWVVDKPTKLTTIYDRISLLRTRFALIRSSIDNEYLRQKLALIEQGESIPADMDDLFVARLAEVDDFLRFLERANTPGEFMEDEDLQQLQKIASQRYDVAGETQSYLNDDEMENLSVRKGSLTDAERQKINDHADMSIRMLEQIPFTRKLQQVAPIAGAHHEKLDGTGYPRGLMADEISVQARILAMVDIFESLSAADRPYRAKPMSREMVLKILQKEVDANHIDGNLYELFLKEELYLELDRIKAEMVLEKGTADS